MEPQQRPFPRTRLGCASLLLLLLAVPASAQSSQGTSLEPLGPPLVTMEEAAPLEDETPAPGTVRRHGAVRVGAEVGGMLVTSLGLGVAGVLGGGLVGIAGCTSEGTFNFCPIVAVLTGGLVGLGVGMPLGVWWGGGKAGGNGSLAAAFGGLGVSFASAGAAHLLGAENLGALLLATAPVLTIVGYELSDSAPKSPTSTGLTPAVSVGSGGASFGLQGRF